MNRAQRRAREKAQSRNALTSMHFAKGEVADESLPPEPGPIGTELGKYRFGGKVWVLMTFHQPNVSTRVVMSPADVLQLAKDMEKIALGMDLTEKQEDIAEPSPTESGIVVAREMPRDR